MDEISVRIRERGFSVIELLVALTLFVIIVGLSWPSLQKLILRSKLEAVTRETASVFAIARFEAIKIGRPTVVQINTSTNSVRAFVDEDENGDRNGAERVLRTYDLPRFVEFGGPRSVAAPTSNAVLGFTTGPTGKPNQVVFETNGAVRDTGAFRIRENKVNARNKENYMEVSLPVRAAMRVTVRKWEDILMKWMEQGEDDKEWKWKV